MRVIGVGDGELIGDSADRRVEILAEFDAAHATISRFAAGRDGADLHIHRHHHDVFYVASGALTLKVAEGERTVGAGNVVCVPPMVAHGFRNGSSEDVVYVNLHMPGVGFADYMRGLRDGARVAFDQEPPADGVLPSDEISVGPPPVKVDGMTVLVADGVLSVADLLAIRLPAGAG